LRQRSWPGRPLAGRGPDPPAHQPLDAPVAAGSAEHEVDRRQQALLVEDVDDLLALRDVDASRSPMGAAMVLAGTAASLESARSHLLAVEGDHVRVRSRLA